MRPSTHSFLLAALACFEYVQHTAAHAIVPNLDERSFALSHNVEERDGLVQRAEGDSPAGFMGMYA